jgi:protein-disulfide isomerase
MITSWLPGVALGAILLAPGFAQQATTDDLKKEIGALQQTMQGMQKDLQEIKALLAARPAPGGSPSPIGTEIDVSDSRLRGEPTAKLTLVEFSDYQCGFCARYMRQTYPQLEAEYIKTGKLRLMLVDMPIESIHKVAFKGAETARCAGEQGKYWEMHDRLFSKQEALEPWTGHAEALGLDVAKFNSCMESGKFAAGIRNNVAQAQKLGVTGTPSFMLARTIPNSSKVRVLGFLVGAQPFSAFKAQIDSLLAEQPAGDRGNE